MQLPVVVIRLCLNGPGSQKLVLVNKFVVSRKRQVPDLSKELLQGLCQLASTEKDRCLIKYVVCHSHSLGSKQSQHLYGV